MMLREKSLRPCPTLFFANKQDLPAALSAVETAQALGLADIRDRCVCVRARARTRSLECRQGGAFSRCWRQGLPAGRGSPLPAAGGGGPLAVTESTSSTSSPSRVACMRACGAIAPSDPLRVRVYASGRGRLWRQTRSRARASIRAWIG